MNYDDMNLLFPSSQIYLSFSSAGIEAEREKEKIGRRRHATPEGKKIPFPKNCADWAHRYLKDESCACACFSGGPERNGETNLKIQGSLMAHFLSLRHKEMRLGRRERESRQSSDCCGARLRAGLNQALTEPTESNIFRPQA